MKSTAILLVIFLLASPLAWAQNVPKIIYFPQVLLGGGLVCSEDQEKNKEVLQRTCSAGTVIDGWETTYQISNSYEKIQSNQATTTNLTLVFSDQSGRLKSSVGIFLKQDDLGELSEPIIKKSEIPIDSTRTLIKLNPLDAQTQSIAAYPSYPDLKTAWAKIFYLGNEIGTAPEVYATLKLYSQGQVVSQIGMNGVEAKNANYLRVFESKVDGQKTALALVNPAPEGSPQAAEVTFRLISPVEFSKGLVLGQKTLTVGPDGRFSVFVRDLFPEIENDYWWKSAGVFFGFLEIKAKVAGSDTSWPIPVMGLNSRSVAGVGWFASTFSAIGK